MRHSPPRRGRRRAGEDGAAAPAPDRLSALPDALLHRVLSRLKAWEVVRTCVLARRWRHLWASAPCVDLRIRAGSDGDDEAPEEFARFSRRLFRGRDASAAVDTLRLRSSDADGAFDEDDAKSWIRAGIKRKARFIHLIGHRNGLAVLEHAAFVSSHLKILKLSYAMLDGNLLRQLSSCCPSLEEMDLKDCLVTDNGISSASLKTLTMVKCTFNVDFSVAAPNLVLLCCIKPIGKAPSFQNLGDDKDGYGKKRKRKAKPTVMSDDDELDGDTDDDEFDGDSDDDELDETSEDDSDDGKKRKRKAGAGYGFGLPQKIHRPGVYKDVQDYGSDIESDDDTFEYSDIANDCDVSSYDGIGQSSGKDGSSRQVFGENSGSNDSKVLGGQNVLHSLSNATSLELLADAGEVILTRELKSCQSFSNLKTLSLGEWCMGDDFDNLIFFLQHSPNLERLFLELKLNLSIRKPLETGVKPKGRSFACKHLQMVKIKCSKDDVRVHKLAHLFRANGVSVDKIFVRRTGSACELYLLFTYQISYCLQCLW
ncbi:unnamed protein product [Urochloa decumbens]|uniref:F-box domain-containing protein n=1 Tax=Urochloa decumbens TaxID=240449 RepID=A0ABC9BUE8_9POAL